jgi:putative ubiquitin-RnfH superfamily antitoxin RatB of RatAB toxin-antitoxin module
VSEINTPQAPLKMILVTVVASEDGNLWRREQLLPLGTTIEECLVEIGYFLDFPGKSLETLVVGVYGKHMPLNHRLEDHDRVEIYKSLQVDPKTARRRRAAHREKTRNIKKKMPVNDMTR